MNLPEELLRLGAGRLTGIPAPVVILGITVAAAQWVLGRSRFGRQIYAIGNNVEGARKAGINVCALTTAVYLVSGFRAALGGLVAVAQLGAVSPTAAVLGGTSLFGGRGSVLTGTVVGAVLIQSVETGLVIVNADPYLYPMLLAAVIFAAVLLDGLRQRQIDKLTRRKIRPVAA